MVSWTRQIQTTPVYCSLKKNKNNNNCLLVHIVLEILRDAVIDIKEHVYRQLAIDFLFGYLHSSVRKLCMGRAVTDRDRT